MHDPETREKTIASFFGEHSARWRGRYGTAQYVDWDYQIRGHIALTWLAALGRAGGRRLLEIGCGAGVQSAAAARSGWEVVSVDFSEQMLAQAQQQSRDPLWLAAAAEALPFRPHSYDVVLMNGVIGYAADPLRTLDAVREQLRPGGRLIVSWASPPPLLLDTVSRVVSAIPDAAYLTLKRIVTRRPNAAPAAEPGFYQQYFRRWTPEEFYQLLASAGFAIDRVRSQNFGRFRFMDHDIWPERVDMWLSAGLDRLAGTAPHRRLRDGARTHIALVTPEPAEHRAPV